MKRLILMTALILVLFSATQVSALVHTFVPDPPDVYDLDHYYYYTWGIEWYQDVEIDDVVLTFKNIRNWDATENSLFIRLLDDAPVGLVRSYDDVSDISDQFLNQGILIDEWQDTDPSSTGIDLTYSLSDLGFLDDFSAYLNNDGLVAFGFDPDCHYWNDGVELSIISDVPEPATFLLFGLGLVGGRLVRRKFKK